jgi:predicted aspartyl protease
VRFEYTIVPSEGTDPEVAIPILDVQLATIGQFSRKTPLFPAFLDTGATYCLFHAEIGRSIQIPIERGTPGETVCANGQSLAFFIHEVRLMFDDYRADLSVGFSDDLPYAGLLGRIGFFDQFKVTFDQSLHPPEFEIVPIRRNLSVI